MKRKLKNSQTAIKSRLYYQKKKLKEIVTEIKKYTERDTQKKSQFKGKKRTHKTISDMLLNEGKKINNVISDLERKLHNYTSRDSFKKSTREAKRGKKKRGEVLKEIGNVWHRKDFDRHLSLSRIKAINGLNKNRDYDKIQSLADQMFLRMDSTDIACILERPDGSAEIFLIKESSQYEKPKFTAGKTGKRKKSK